MKNVLQYLEKNAVLFKNKIAFRDIENSFTYEELLNECKRIGSSLSNLNKTNRPIAIYLDKSVKVLSSMFGIVYSGNFYVVLDSEMPKSRIDKCFSTLNPLAIITDEKHLENAKELDFDGEIFIYDDLIKEKIKEDVLLEIRNKQIDTDILYVLFTSGSTGVPKGSIITHKNVISYISWVSEEFEFDENTIFANQTPFYFSMSVTDVYSTLKTGATLVIVPKIYFSYPLKLISFLNEFKVNTLYWVVSALSIVSNFNLFKYDKPKYLKKVLFAGEVMPIKHLNYWINNLSDDILFANLYGPTETTDICTFYKIDRKFKDDEILPIGKHCDNCDVIIVNEKGEEAKAGEEGELYVRGSFLSLGYYNNPQKTKEAFVQNPLNNAYPEIVYKTGDLVKLNEFNEIMYLTRKDFQIKHMGYRIELLEIEAVASSLKNVEDVCVIYDENNKKIVLFYKGRKVNENDFFEFLSNKLPPYLVPNKIIKLKQMPQNQNGKIDRLKLKNLI